MLIVGSSLLALCVAARRLGVGVAVGDQPPSLWLALMFLIGAALILIVLVGKLVDLVRNR